MDPLNDSARRVARAVGLLLLGALGTLGLIIGVLLALQPLRPVVYNALYLQLGPWTSELTTTITSFALAATVGIGVPPIVSATVLGGDRGRLRELLAGFVGLLIAVPVVFLGAAFVGLIGFLTVIAVFAVLTVAIPVGAFFRDFSRSSIITFIGGVPVLVVAVFVLGFGLGWGGGYSLAAEEVPASEVSGPVASFDEAPVVRDDLYASGRCTADEGVCRLELRGYEYEARAAQFLARNGVRCPLRSTGGTRMSFIAEHDGTLYRITCIPYGD